MSGASWLTASGGGGQGRGLVDRGLGKQ